MSENPIKMDDLGVPPSILGNLHMWDVTKKYVHTYILLGFVVFLLWSIIIIFLIVIVKLVLYICCSTMICFSTMIVKLVLYIPVVSIHYT